MSIILITIFPQNISILEMFSPSNSIHGNADCQQYSVHPQILSTQKPNPYLTVLYVQKSFTVYGISIATNGYEHGEIHCLKGDGVTQAVKEIEPLTKQMTDSRSDECDLSLSIPTALWTPMMIIN